MKIVSEYLSSELKSVQELHISALVWTAYDAAALPTPLEALVSEVKDITIR